jgi:hypothetical protein
MTAAMRRGGASASLSNPFAAASSCISIRRPARNHRRATWKAVSGSRRRSGVCHQFPVSVVTDGQGLNITVVSYLDRLDFGFIVDRELVHDVWDLADMHVDEIERLFAASGAEWAEPPQAAEPRRGRARRASASDPTVC